MTEIASLKISVDAREASSAAKEIAKISPEAIKAERSVDKLSTASKNLGRAAVGLASALAGGALFQSVISNTIESESAMAQLEATIKSTGGAAGLSSDQLALMAQGLQKVTTFGDDAIISMQSQLLTFTKIGGDVVPQATEAILDLATKMGGDLKGAAVQVGKALNDPIQGINALSRVGVSFTDSQKDVIKSLVETGDIAGAQAMILQELQVEFGGSARAARDTFGGAITSLNNALGDLLEGEGGNLNEAKASVEGLTDALSDPRVKQSFDTIVAGILNTTSAIAKALPEISDFTKWASEEFAATFNGAAIGDIVRLDDELTNLQDRLKSIRSTRYTDPEDVQEIERQIAATRTKIQITNEMAEADRVASVERVKAKAVTDSISKKDAENKAAELARKQAEAEKEKTASEAMKASNKAASEARKADLEKEKESAKANIGAINSLKESINQASLSAENLAKRQAELRLNKYATPEQIGQIRTLGAELQKIEARNDAGSKFEKAIATLPAGESPEIERLRLEHDEKRAIIDQAYKTEYINKQIHDQSMIELDNAYASQRKKILEDATASDREQALSSAASIISITSAQISTMQGLYDQGSAAGRAFFLFSQALAGANAIIQGFQSAMAIRVAYAQMAAMSGPAAPAVLAAGEAHANVAMGMGFATAGMIAGQTMASFEGGGFTGSGSRSGGMDGKGGFMAMVHPNETIIDHTKGGKYGNVMPIQSKSNGVSVTQNIMVQGNVDRRTSSQIARDTDRKQRVAQSRFG